jgi:hypothetical protein
MPTGAKALRIRDRSNATVFEIDWQGGIQAPELSLMLNADNPSSWALEKDDDPDSNRYRGPFLNVKEELQFLRGQLREVMEKLKMTPDAGWEVWDGESAS